jgi:hypothetical protein
MEKQFNKKEGFEVDESEEVGNGLDERDCELETWS